MIKHIGDTDLKKRRSNLVHYILLILYFRLLMRGRGHSRVAEEIVSMKAEIPKS